MLPGTGTIKESVVAQGWSLHPVLAYSTVKRASSMRGRAKGALVGLSLLLAGGARGAVKFGPSGGMDCSYPNPLVTVTPAGVRRYTLIGGCQKMAGPDTGSVISFTATDSYDPITRMATEQMQGSGWAISTTWACGSDPWLLLAHTGGTCTRNGYSPSGDAPDLSWNSDGGPFSAYQMPVETLAELLKRATPPAPALPPRDVKAVLQVASSRTRLDWGLPADQTSFNATVAWFKVRRHPVGTASPWIPASDSLPASTTSYVDPDVVSTTTEYIVCAGNVSGWKCSPAVVASLNLPDKVTLTPVHGARASASKVSTVEKTGSSAWAKPTVAPTAPYAGVDNRLYRVEVHDAPANAAALKWSRNPPYGATYTVSTTPAIRAGKTTVVPVTVLNGSSVPWPAGGAFRLSYHWYRSETEVVHDGDRTLLSATVNPEGTATLNAKVTGPPIPGAYTLKWDMVQEGVAWFSSKGIATKDQIVTVAP